MTSGLIASPGPAIENHSSPTHELPNLAKCSSPIGLNLTEYVALDLRLTQFLWMEEQVVPPVHHDYTGSSGGVRGSSMAGRLPALERGA